VGEKELANVLKHENVSHDQVNQIVERYPFNNIYGSYVMEQLYDMTFFKITHHFKQKDAFLQDQIQSIKYIDTRALGLINEDERLLPKAILEFKRLASLRTPYEKLKCLVTSIQLFMSLKMTADQLIPIMILLVIRGNVLHLHSNVYYLKQFSFEHDTVSGEFGFALSTLEAAMSYIEEKGLLLTKYSNQNQQLWKAIKEGNVEYLKTINQGYSPVEGEIYHFMDLLMARTVDGNHSLFLAILYERLEIVKLRKEKIIKK
jgi:hypothetical protein